ncbi:unnamed protein product, partial [Ectocarpus sp. 12 AP-2014]
RYLFLFSRKLVRMCSSSVQVSGVVESCTLLMLSVTLCSRWVGVASYFCVVFGARCVSVHPRSPAPSSFVHIHRPMTLLSIPIAQHTDKPTQNLAKLACAQTAHGV